MFLNGFIVTKRWIVVIVLTRIPMFFSMLFNCFLFFFFFWVLTVQIQHEEYQQGGDSYEQSQWSRKVYFSPVTDVD